MDTPICDFVRHYCESGALRMHMPGHKGRSLLGMEALDLTEIDGADELYHAHGIIRQSEENAAALFGTAKTLYSAEGSSLCIRAMLYLALLHAKAAGKRPVICAARNAHKVFVTAAALLGLDVTWLSPKSREHVIACEVDAGLLEQTLEAEHPAAVYLTNPDYLGHLADIRALADVCHKHDTLLLVDNAHGAYLHFLPVSRHPMDLGADICCDSAHKTLPVLTGGAYLHLSRSAPKALSDWAQDAMSVFASTSPSYLILQSLDAANRYLAEGYPARLAETVERLSALKARLAAHGYTLDGAEPLKLTLMPKDYGYTGAALAEALQRDGIFCEFADPDFLVMMCTPETSPEDFNRLESALLKTERRAPLPERPPKPPLPERVLSPREALLSPHETVPSGACVGRVLASANVSCPPAVPVAVCGERVDEAVLRCLRYYGVESCTVCMQ
ncbi:MAG: aminotransferase class V-fold PLP-dependent enzyme [Hominenteromicrobium sp.]